MHRQLIHKLHGTSYRYIRTVNRGTDKISNHRTELAQKIDAPSSESNDLPHKSIYKLRKGLQKKDPVRVSESLRGSLETLGEEIADVINSMLTLREFQQKFPDIGGTETTMEIAEVIVNSDLSHATLLWTSSILDGFAEMVLESKGHEDCGKFCVNSTKILTKRLQACEPRFRATLARKMRFKRIPRLFFRPLDPLLGTAVREEDHRQEFLRSNASKVSFHELQQETDDAKS